MFLFWNELCYGGTKHSLLVFSLSVSIINMGCVGRTRGEQVLLSSPASVDPCYLATSTARVVWAESLSGLVQHQVGPSWFCTSALLSPQALKISGKGAAQRQTLGYSTISFRAVFLKLIMAGLGPARPEGCVCIALLASEKQSSDTYAGILRAWLRSRWT